MKIDKTLELKFVKVIQKQKSKWTNEDLNVVLERNSLVNKHFKINTEVSNQLQKLNSKLRLEEKRIFPFYRNLKLENEKLVREKIIDDFNLEVIISSFSDNHYKDLDSQLKGNSIIQTNCNFMLHQDENEYLEEDWKEFALNEPLLNFKHCYSFHHLYDHTDLTWYDLSFIEDIWLEIKVDYQFFLQKFNLIK